MKICNALIASAFVLTSANVNAATFNFTGSINNHNDVVTTNFTLNSNATNVRLWTDSFMDGINFDPITALWDAAGNLIIQNSNDSYINPETQTSSDSGFHFLLLEQGNYSFTVATYNNWALGAHISDGFTFDAEAPISLSEWNQPANGTNMGQNWSVWIDGVDSANIAPVPEPSTYALMLGGLGLVGFMANRRRRECLEISIIL